MFCHHYHNTLTSLSYTYTYGYSLDVTLVKEKLILYLEKEVRGSEIYGEISMISESTI